MNLLHYDGSFEGFLTAVFESYARKWQDVRICKAQSGASTLFGEVSAVVTDVPKAMRVWNGLKTRTSEAACRLFYYNYLSEIPNSEDWMLEYVRYVFASDADVSSDYSNPAVSSIARTAKSVGREKHRMEAFVRFELTADQVYYAAIEPDFNVLPLLIKHFKSRYADQRWIIWDKKRQYGLRYDLDKVELIYEPAASDAAGEPSQLDYSQLWKTYFKSTNILERRNMKLHLQHVPLRYWKYLSEKQP